MDAGLSRIRIGTRGSLLARTQTEWVAGQLTAAHPDLQVEIVILQTTGDLNRDRPFAAVGTRGMFVKEIETALLEGEIDLGVHSLKDMPSELPAGLQIACVPPREDARDALIARDAVTLETLPQGACVGTSSPRRQAQLRRHRPDLQVIELRGNLDTRLRKLDQGDYDAILLASAGLNRLGLSHRITQSLPPDLCIPAVGQGALALETRTNDLTIRSVLAAIHDPETAVAVEAERAFQEALDGGCTLPAGAYAVMTEGSLVIRAFIASPDGRQLTSGQAVGMPDAARSLGADLALQLLESGGRAFLKG